METRLLKYLRLIQLISSLAVFLLGLWLWWRMYLVDHSNGKKFASTEVWLMLLIVAPGVFVAFGSLLQAARKVWPFALVLLGSVVALWFIGLGAQLAFGMAGDRFALHAVYADVVLLFITVAASILNAVLELVGYFSKIGVEETVGREGRWRAS
jgi:hypothetical protein